MSERMPQFQLEKIYADGNREELELHRLESIDASCRMGRRGFLMTSALCVGTLLSCKPAQEAKQKPAIPTVREDITSSLLAHQIDAPNLAFHPDGKLLATCGEGGLDFWEMPDGEARYAPVYPSNRAIALARTACGRK